MTQRPVSVPRGPGAASRGLRERRVLNVAHAGGDLEAPHSTLFAMKRAVVTRTMPPWLAHKDCVDYADDISLTDLQIKTISKWVDTGAKKGDPKIDHRDSTDADHQVRFTERDCRLTPEAPAGK